jgi:heterodisulfide reductase subunit D
LSGFNLEVVHISQVLADAVANDKLKFKPHKQKVTYQDPCRLGRFSQIYDEPRRLLYAIPDLDFVEMEKNRSSALCCGTQAWLNCGTVNKQIQEQRLQEADDTGAGVLVTACPKCQIHFACAQKDELHSGRKRREIQDLNVMLARLLDH